MVHVWVKVLSKKTEGVKTGAKIPLLSVACHGMKKVIPPHQKSIHPDVTCTPQPLFEMSLIKIKKSIWASSCTMLGLGEDAKVKVRVKVKVRTRFRG